MFRIIVSVLVITMLLAFNVESKEATRGTNVYLNKFAKSIDEFKISISDVTKEDVLLSWFSKGADMSPDYVLKKGSSGKEIFVYKPEEKALSAFIYGVSDFKAKKYYEALKKFNTALQLDPEFHKVYLFIGDIFFMLGHYEEAIKHFNKVLKKSPIDYIANLYIADSYWKMGELALAKKYLIRSLILNVRNGKTWGKLRGLGELMGFDVTDERFIPLVLIDEKSKQVKVKSDIWIDYGLCKSVWRNDREFFKMKTKIVDYKHTITEEYECVENLLLGIKRKGMKNYVLKVPSELKRLQKIASAGDLYGLVIMEIYLPQNPVMAALVTEKDIENLSSYIEKHILVKPQSPIESFAHERRKVLSSL